jgi:hypothetical protein
VFALLAQALAALPSSKPHPGTVYAFEMRLLAELGLDPDLGASHLTGGAREILKSLGSAEWEAVHRLRLSREQTEEIGRFLGEFLLFHLGRVPRARASACGPGGEAEGIRCPPSSLARAG